MTDTGPQEPAVTAEEMRRRSQDGRASPFIELVGGRLEEIGDGYMRVSLTLEPHHTNPNGVMHGGVITTLMDDVLGGAIATLRGPDTLERAPHATVDMNVSFLSGARPGDRIDVEGRVLKLGRAVAFGEAEARRARTGASPGDGDLIAKGRMTFAILNRAD